MAKTLWNWFVGSRTAAIIVLGAGVVVGFRLSQAIGYPRYDSSPSLLPYGTSFRELVASMVPIVILLGALGCLSTCIGMRIFNLRAFWPGVRRGLTMASFLLWVLWLDVLVEIVYPTLHKRWVVLYDNSLGPFLAIIVLFVIVVYCLVVLILSVVRVSRRMREAEARREAELDSAIRTVAGSQRP